MYRYRQEFHNTPYDQYVRTNLSFYITNTNRTKGVFVHTNTSSQLPILASSNLRTAFPALCSAEANSTLFRLLPLNNRNNTKHLSRVLCLLGA